MAESEATPDEIRRLERLASLGWPVLNEISADGWLLGSSGAYTRRANCIHPVGAPERALGAQVEAAEAYYASRGRSAVFKMTSAAQPESLDAFLEARGYGRHSETIVMLLPHLSEPPCSPEPDLQQVIGKFESTEARPSQAWLEASCGFSQVPGELRADYQAILEHLNASARDCQFGAWRIDGVIRSVALAVTCEGVTAFHQVATDPELRGRRYAERVLDAFLRSVPARGAASAMLSVEADNTSARRLYDRLGFGEVYRYWYRER